MKIKHSIGTMLSVIFITFIPSSSYAAYDEKENKEAARLLCKQVVEDSGTGTVGAIGGMAGLAIATKGYGTLGAILCLGTGGLGCAAIAVGGAVLLGTGTLAAMKAGDKYCEKKYR